MRGSSNRDWVYDFEVGRENEPLIQYLPNDKVAVCVSMRDIVINPLVSPADRRVALSTLLTVKADKTTGRLGDVPDDDLAAIAKLVCPEQEEFWRQVWKNCNRPADGMSLANAITHLDRERSKVV